MKKAGTKYIDFLAIAALGVMSILLLRQSAYVNAYGGDIGDASYGMLAGIAKILENGELPLWNPYLWGGMTLVGVSTSQAFYPITYLLCMLCYNEEAGMLSFSAIAFFSVVIHLFILAAGIYFLLRVLKMHPLIAFSVASMAAFSGCGLRMRGWQNLYSSTAYIPLFLGLAVLMMKRDGKKSLLYSALGGLVLGLSGLASASHGVLILIVAFAVLYFVYMWSFRQDKKRMLRITGYSFLTGSIGMGITSIALLPFIQFLGDSYRYLGDGSVDAIEGQVKTPFESFIGHSLEMGDIRSIIGNYSGWIALGTVLIVFAFIGLFCKIKEDKSDYWLGVILLFFGLLYPCSLFLNNIVFYIPFFNQIRESFLYSCIFATGGAIVGAYGLQAVCNVKQGEKLAGTFYNPTGLLLCCGIILFDVLFPQKFTWISLIMVCGIISMLCMHKFLHIRMYWTVMSVILLCLVGLEFYTFRSELDRGGHTVHEAVETISDININALRLLDSDDLPTDEDSWRVLQWNTESKAYPANIWSVWGYYDALAYINPSPSNVMNIHLTWGLDKRMCLSNIRYVVCTSQEQEGFLEWLKALGLKEVRRVDGIIPDYDAQEGIEAIVFENENRKGNAWLVEECVGYSEKNSIDELNGMINSSDFDPFHTALVNADTSSVPLKERYGNANESDFHMVEYNANSVKFEVNAADEVLMVTSEMIAPGWEVYIDGKKGDILEVNTAYRGCVVPQGEHVVEYRYLPKAFVAGCILAGISLLAVIVICISCMWSGKRKQK